MRESQNKETAPGQGTATERLWELFDAGESVAQIAAGYDMADELVRAAVAYEEQLRSLAA